MADRIKIQPKIARSVYFPFRDLSHAMGVSVETAIETLMRDALERTGIVWAKRRVDEIAAPS